MVRYIVVSLVAGVLFGVLDGVINANPLAVALYAIYKPLARDSVNAAGGMVIDLLYGFVLGGLFLLLYDSLPGGLGLLKGLSFGLLVWFLRVAMSVASQWVMYRVPLRALLYTLAAGLAEMLVLGALYGLALGSRA